MYKLGGRRKLGRKASHRKALIRNQVRSLLISGKVVTTTPKAKVLKANAESYLSSVKNAEKMQLKKELTKYTGSEKSAEQLMKYLKATPKVSVVKVGYREGDNAQQSRVSLVGYSELKVKKQAAKKGKPKKEDKKEETADKDTADDIKQKGGKPEGKSKNDGLSKSLRSRFVKKDRARSRSGL